MNTVWKDVDIVLLLQLHTVLSQDEIQEVLDSLAQDIWFRILNKKIKKLLSKDQYRELANKHALESNLNLIITNIQTLLPTLNIRQLLDETSAEVKKEYALEYLKTMGKHELATYISSDQYTIEELYKKTAEEILAPT